MKKKSKGKIDRNNKHQIIKIGCTEIESMKIYLQLELFVKVIHQ